MKNEGFGKKSLSISTSNQCLAECICFSGATQPKKEPTISKPAFLCENAGATSLRHAEAVPHLLLMTQVR